MKMCYKLLLGLVLIVGVLVSGCVEQSIVDFDDAQPKKYCEKDDDCVPATCCHSKECINKLYQPTCKGIDCTEEDIPDRAYSLDDCICKNNLCVNKNR